MHQGKGTMFPVLRQPLVWCASDLSAKQAAQQQKQQ
jgi:hypothetical protein